MKIEIEIERRGYRNHRLNKIHNWLFGIEQGSARHIGAAPHAAWRRGGQQKASSRCGNPHSGFSACHMTRGCARLLGPSSFPPTLKLPSHPLDSRRDWLRVGLQADVGTLIRVRLVYMSVGLRERTLSLFHELEKEPLARPDLDRESNTYLKPRRNDPLLFLINR